MSGSDTNTPLAAAVEALEQIALAGMSGSGQESEEGLRDWHARRAWEFIGIAARALEPARSALAEQEQAEPVWIRPDDLAKARIAPHFCRIAPAQAHDFVALHASQPVATPEESSAVIEDSSVTGRACSECEGMGLADGVGVPCGRCGGSGAQPEPAGRVGIVQHIAPQCVGADATQVAVFDVVLPPGTWLYAQPVAAPAGWAVHHNALSRAVECLAILHSQPSPMCRDCADHDGVCPNSGLDCNMGALFKAARDALAWIVTLADTPAAQPSDPCAPPEVWAAIESGEFEPGEWTVSDRRSIEKNPGAALRIIASLRNRLSEASLAAAPAAPAQAQPLTDAQILEIGVRHSSAGQFNREFSEADFNSAARAIERAHGIGQPVGKGGA